MILANMLAPGKRILISGEGLYTVPALLTSNMTIKVKLGNTIIASATTSSLLLGADKKAISLNIRLVCRSLGATGSVVAGGTINYTNVSGQKFWDNTGSVVTVDTTVDQMVDVTATWNLASTTRSITMKICPIMVA